MPLSCHEASLPASHPSPCRLWHPCPPPSPSPARSPHPCSVSKKTTGVPVTFLLLLVGLARSGKSPGCYPRLGESSFLLVPFFVKAMWVKGRKRRGRILIFPFFSRCSGVTGMGMNPFPGSHQQNLLKGTR